MLLTKQGVCCEFPPGWLQVEKDYISNAGFTPANIKSKSGAAAGLCSWVINICKYFRIYQVTLLAFNDVGLCII